MAFLDADYLALEGCAEFKSANCWGQLPKLGASLGRRELNSEASAVWLSFAFSCPCCSGPEKRLQRKRESRSDRNSSWSDESLSAGGSRR